MAKRITAAKHSGYKGNPTQSTATAGQRDRKKNRIAKQKADTKAHNDYNLACGVFRYYLNASLQTGLLLMGVSVVFAGIQSLLSR